MGLEVRAHPAGHGACGSLGPNPRPGLIHRLDKTALPSGRIRGLNHQARLNGPMAFSRPTWQDCPLNYTSWVDLLPAALTRIRTTPHSKTGLTPFELLYE
ncbi:uncharacterized protein LOC129541833 isoform X2 [Moschus berezovskii]|uniref:uncharacterized protein LOC129541833 isoform X2 n=1 Tax=Moschus berezovskii TaxID=68408 RepID=UPI0024449C0B|nr:uncharacterized protein LOC129541833 isoform X2 [Moschus berezovskii]